MNRLKHALIFSERGVVYDRNGVELAWNVPDENDSFAHRRYIEKSGFSHVLGYLNYPKKDKSNIYYQDRFVGVDGLEKTYNQTLSGDNGLKIIEANALSIVQSESIIRPPENGVNVTLSIDSRVQSKFHTLIADTARESRFEGGSGVIMNIETGEILAMASYPEYDSGILTEGKENNRIAEYIQDERKPFLNRVINGLYTPGSIVKPFIAIAALNEGTISPEKEILSTGSISLQNPYFPDLFTVFKDWKAHGYVDMQRAIAVSSNVYFYTVGGGFEDQEGVGIEQIERYVRMFGLGEETGINFGDEDIGTIPSPLWKKENFEGADWTVGNTYHTSIGQYGFQVTPIQMVRAIAAIASDGKLVEPTIDVNAKTESEEIRIPGEHFRVIKEGMREAVVDGSAQGLQFANFKVAAKTGTAEVGAGKRFVNSSIIGFFPYEAPKYAFVVIMESAPQGTLKGSVFVARSILEWMTENTSEYTQ